MDSKEVNVSGLIKDLHVTLAIFQDISLTLDVVLINVIYAWGIILSHKWDANIGGNIQMGLSYATIPTYENTFVTLHHEQMRTYHVEYPLDPMNEFVFYEHEL
jgi:hypothetical protein